METFSQFYASGPQPQRVPLFTAGDFVQVYPRDKAGDVFRILQTAGVDPSGAYTLDQWKRFIEQSQGWMSGTSRGYAAQALAYLESYNDLLLRSPTAYPTAYPLPPSQQPLGYDISRLPLWIQQTIASGQASGLSWNPQTRTWNEVSGGLPDLLYDGLAERFYYLGQEISPSQVEALLSHGPTGVPHLLPPDQQPYPRELLDAMLSGQATGLSWHPRYGWVQDTTNPELVYVGSTDQLFYRGMPLSPEQAERVIAQGPVALGPEAGMRIAQGTIFDTSFLDDLYSGLAGMPSVQPGVITPGSILPPPPIIAPIVDPAQVPWYIQYPPEILAPQIPAPYFDVGAGAPLPQLHYTPIEAPQVGEEGDVRWDPERMQISPPDIPVASIDVPLGEEFRQALISSQYDPFRREWERQKALALDRKRAELAATGLLESAAGQWMLRDMENEFDRRLADALADATSRATAQYYDAAIRISADNAQLAQQRNLARAEMDYNAQIANAQNYLQVQLTQLQRRFFDITNALEVARFNAQMTQTVEAQNIVNELQRREAALRQEIANAELAMRALSESARYGMEAQLANAQSILQTQALNMQKDLSMAQMANQVRLANAGMSIDAQRANAQFLLTTNVTNLQAALEAATANQQYDLQRQLVNLQAYLNALQLPLQAVLAVRDDMLAALGLMQDDIARMDAYNLNLLSLMLNERLGFLSAIINMGQYSMSRQEGKATGPTEITVGL
ncbi:MAG: hypothetical protein QXD59_01780 [Candidatus Caldarchaeum sp.]